MKDTRFPAVLVSACLLGITCKYDGGDNRNEKVFRLNEKCHLIPVCPEQLGGLSTPRLPSEIRDGKVYASDGTDVTRAFVKGAQMTLQIGQTFGCQCAIMKARSPSCGCGLIYDGTFSGVKTEGDGMTASLLKKNGIQVYTEEKIDEFIREGNL